MKNWQKKGLIYCAHNPDGWARDGASLPVPFLVAPDRLRIYIAITDEHNVSRIAYVDVNPDCPSEVLAVSRDPVLDIGGDGTFDDNGVVPISLVDLGDTLHLYYVGFQLGVKRRYYLFSGLAISTDRGDSFQRYQRTPILDRCDNELSIRTAPYVIREQDRWRMWYLGGSDWVDYHGKQLPVYRVKYLESEDGIQWGTDSVLALDHHEGEHGFGRPCVLPVEGGYEMYYSRRLLEKGYRLGYARSDDGIQWERRDEEMVIDVSPGGWDSEMICYGTVYRYGDRTYLFYNGNGYGRTGLGYAELQS